MTAPYFVHPFYYKSICAYLIFQASTNLFSKCPNEIIHGVLKISFWVYCKISWEWTIQQLSKTILLSVIFWTSAYILLKLAHTQSFIVIICILIHLFLWMIVILDFIWIWRNWKQTKNLKYHRAANQQIFSLGTCTRKLEIIVTYFSLNYQF